MSLCVECLYRIRAHVRIQSVCVCMRLCTRLGRVCVYVCVFGHCVCVCGRI